MPLLETAEPSIEEEKKTTKIGTHAQVTKQDSVLSNSGGGVALSGRNKLSLGFYNLNSDFALPSDFKLVKKLGKGAYGQVM